MCMIFVLATYFDYFITPNIFWKVWYLPEFGMWKNPLFQLSVEVLILLRSYPALFVWSDVGAWVLWRARRVTYLPWHTRKIRRILDLTCDLLWKIVCPASISPMSSSFATCTWAVWRLDVKWCLNCLEWAILGDKIYANRIWVNHVNLNDEPHTRNDLTSQAMWFFS